MSRRCSTLTSQASVIFTCEKSTPWNWAPLKSASTNRALRWSSTSACVAHGDSSSSDSPFESAARRHDRANLARTGGVRRGGRGVLPPVASRSGARAGGRRVARPPAPRRDRAARHALGVVAADERAPARSRPRLPRRLRVGPRRRARRARRRCRRVLLRRVRAGHAHGDVRAGSRDLPTGRAAGRPRRGDDREPPRDARRRRRRADRRPARRGGVGGRRRRAARCSPGWRGRPGRTTRSAACGGPASWRASTVATATSRRASPTAGHRSR